MANIYDIDGNTLYLDTNKWSGKKIWWCGTSIPAGKDPALGVEGNGMSYPLLVGDLLGATVYNVAAGSSMCRANVRTGDYVNAYAVNILYSLSQTLEEKNSIIANWDTIKQSMTAVSGYETLTDAIKTQAREASFDNKLMPYLDGTNPMPDLFVFDHGHNDWKEVYSIPNPEGAGTIPDIELEPTAANISGNILAEDTYMTANSNAKLVSYFGSLNSIPQAKRNDFIASVNRNCFIGAVNFLCTLILHYNPRARIVFIGNLDNWERTNVWKAQEALSKSWDFPIIRTWENAGFSGHYIPGTEKFWSSSGATALTMKQIYCKDGMHIHTDTTGVSLPMYAQIIANALRNIV